MAIIRKYGCSTHGPPQRCVMWLAVLAPDLALNRVLWGPQQAPRETACCLSLHGLTLSLTWTLAIGVPLCNRSYTSFGCPGFASLHLLDTSGLQL